MTVNMMVMDLDLGLPHLTTAADWKLSRMVCPSLVGCSWPWTPRLSPHSTVTGQPDLVLHRLTERFSLSRDARRNGRTLSSWGLSLEFGWLSWQARWEVVGPRRPRFSSDFWPGRRRGRNHASSEPGWNKRGDCGGPPSLHAGLLGPSLLLC